MNYQPVLDPQSPEWPKMITTTDIQGLLIYERETFSDDRGFFREPVELRDLEKVLGKQITIKQWNHSKSQPKVIRGIHAEEWDKIIYVPKGLVMSVIVDFRTDSPTFGKAVKTILGDNNRKTIYLPKGMGNSFANIGDTDAEYLYLVTDYYEGKPTPAVSWQDPLLTKQFGGWPIDNPIVSEADRKHPTLKEKFGDDVDFSQFPWLQEE